MDSQKDAGLILPGLTPENLKLDKGYRHLEIDSDMFNICERVREVSPSLSIHLIEGPNGEHVYCIMENTLDGEKLVFKTTALDGRVIEHLQYLLKVPFEKRFEEAQKLEEKRQREQREYELDQLVERMAPMQRILEETGFSSAPRGTSYPKRGIYGKRGRYAA